MTRWTGRAVRDRVVRSVRSTTRGTAVTGHQHGRGGEARRVPSSPVAAVAADLRLPLGGLLGGDGQASYEELRALGCRRGQGYLFSRPLPVAQMTSLLERGSGLPVSLLPLDR
jgi:hypothetical protein